MSDKLSKNRKPRILLFWGYHRKGWLHTFFELRKDFEFYYLFHLTKPENEINYSGTSNISYWTDFSSAQDVISRIKPDKIVFMAIEGIHAIALNVVAKSRGIETLVVQHGMFHRYADYLNWSLVELEERKKTARFSQSAEKIDRFFLLRFFLRSVAFVNPYAILFMAKLQYLKRRYVEVEAVKNAPSEFRFASRYVVFTKDNASIFSERDNIKPERLIEIGNPEMDAYFNYQPKAEKSEDDYYLLIDEPWSEIKEYASPGFGISKEQTADFYKKLARFAEKNSAKLKVKLHPYSYNDDLSFYSNIEFIKDTDTVSLIMNSSGVFGFSSTLILPAIYFKRCCLFKIWKQSGFQEDIEKLEMAQILNYHTFVEQDIDFDSYRKNEWNVSDFVEKYFYKTDGKAVQRLKEILEKDVV